MALPQPRGHTQAVTDAVTDGNDNRKEGGRRNIQTLLTDEKMQPVFRALLPKHFTPDRMVRLSIMAVTRTPKLAECHPLTLLGAFIECAALGLEPNSPLQHVHLLPYWNSKLNSYEVNRIIGYRGFIDLAMRTGKVISLHADVAYQRDIFEIVHGTESHLKHIPALGDQDRGEPLAAYCHVKLVDGQAFDVVPWFDVLRIRKRSPAGDRGPWVTDLERMARKTAIRRLFNGGEAPMSIELAHATAVDDRQMDYQGLARANIDEIREALENFAMREEETGQTRQIGQQEERPTEVRTEPQPQTQQQSQGDAASAAGDDDGKPYWSTFGKRYVQPGRAATTWIRLIEGCRTLDDLQTYEAGPEAQKIATLPAANRQAVEQALAHQRSVLEAHAERPHIPSTAAGRPAEGDHPMSSVDHLEPEEFRQAGEQQGGGKGQFNLLGQ